jgi:ATP-dependent Clp protease ATP-binding subunit ClpA
MFERYSIEARRAIFYARYEASQYGSRYIETEHILLGLLWEEGARMGQVLGPHEDKAQIRGEIEKVIARGERISTAVEIPLSEESKRVLRFAAEEATGLGQRYVGPEHLLLGLLRVTGSFATRILADRGVKLAPLREQLANVSGSGSDEEQQPASDVVIATLIGFLASLKSSNWMASAHFFAKKVQFIDATGKYWRGREEIEKQLEALFVPYAKRDVSFQLESSEIGPVGCVLARVLWENVSIADRPARAMHRMTLMLAMEREDWAIFWLQVTPVVLT